MLILTIRTDKPEAEIGLFNGDQQLAYLTWLAHRQLAETIHLKLQELLADHKKDLSDLQGIIVFQGPGSFTGLRIGISVANALADSLKIPIVGASGGAWLKDGRRDLGQGRDAHQVVPEYGAPPHITRPKHDS
ncbi:MAG TPA: tRNA (adenosine(37)-N6)-threonylcarbamoyltransferase complex dimerization subunit type 1 TsaB [Candidatus Saccharimonadales bacterium]|nr:tRNA (adenosine(37)-N6)-threonylcarbamoyltransferase complex dimerization subunit type 1 TsaB [Candidatus Saccharimonadales bacterium]